MGILTQERRIGIEMKNMKENRNRNDKCENRNVKGQMLEQRQK